MVVVLWLCRCDFTLPRSQLWAQDRFQLFPVTALGWTLHSSLTFLCVWMGRGLEEVWVSKKSQVADQFLSSVLSLRGRGKHGYWTSEGQDQGALRFFLSSLKSYFSPPLWQFLTTKSPFRRAGDSYFLLEYIMGALGLDSKTHFSVNHVEVQLVHI